MTRVILPPVGRQHVVAALRLIEIAAVCVVHGMRWLGWCVTAVFSAAARDRRGPGLATLLEDLGPSFVKAGQVLGARPDLTSPPLSAALRRLQEHVRPVPTREVFGAIELAFGAPIATLFAHIDDEPVASGSIAQVHRARLSDGRWVAVKVRRPGVERQVRADFDLLRAIARLLAAVPGLTHVPVGELVDDIGNAVCEQLDFRLEAENQRRLRRAFEHTELLTIPRVVDSLSNDAVLTMEFAADLRNVIGAPTSPLARQRAALAGLRVLYRMIFSIGVVHADMHPGNVFLRRDGGIVLLDFGLVARLGPRDKAAFVDFFFGLITDRGHDCARIIVAGASRLGPRYDAARFEAAICDLVSRHARLRSRDFEIVTFVSQLIAVQRRYDVRGSTAFMTTVLAMVVYDGICRQLHPGCDFQAEARGFLIMARYETAPRLPEGRWEAVALAQ